MVTQAHISADRHSTQGPTGPLRRKEPAVKANWPGRSGLWRKQTQFSGPPMNHNCFSDTDLQQAWCAVRAREQSQWPRSSRRKQRTARAKQSQFGAAAGGKSEMPNSKFEMRMTQTSKRVGGAVAPNKANLACSVPGPREGASAQNALRRHYERDSCCLGAELVYPLLRQQGGVAWKSLSIVCSKGPGGPSGPW